MKTLYNMLEMDTLKKLFKTIFIPSRLGGDRNGGLLPLLIALIITLIIIF